MDKFIALPVVKGAAFYLERAGHYILVDGGSGKNAISNMVRQKCTRIDVLICTHNDADHADGVIELLESTDIPIEEVWIPASWTYRLEDLIKNERNFFKELFHNILEMRDISDEDVQVFYNGTDGRLSEILCQKHEGKYRNTTESLRCDKDLCYEKQKCFEHEQDHDALSALLDIADNFDPWCQNIDCFIDIVMLRNQKPQLQLFSICFQLAKNIKSILRLAYQRGCKIRLFEYGGKPNAAAKDGEEWLSPVNSHEIYSFKQRSKINALYYCQLTVTNRKSLVFYSPETDNAPPVLFSADSDFSFSLPQFESSSPPIITAPHHGAESSKGAYARIQKMFGDGTDFVFVRSDSKTKIRPGATFKEQNNRYCTICCQGNNSKLGEVSFEGEEVKKSWKSTSEKRCTCKGV